jgi:oligoendopeptidase F
MSKNSENISYTAKPDTRVREDIPLKYRWNLNDIFGNWDEWEKAYKTLESKIEKLASYKGVIAKNRGRNLLDFLKLNDEAGIESYKVWYYPALMFDEDSRDNDINAKRLQVQELFAKFSTATSWYSPELLEVGIDKINNWMSSNKDLELYRFSIDELYRQQEHVLDAKGENLMALSSRFGSTPRNTYSMITTADAKFPEITLSDGETVTVSHGAYSSLLHTSRVQEDRKKLFEAHYENYNQHINTYAAIYEGILQRGWFSAQAREYDTVLEAKLQGNNIPTSVVETLIETAKNGTAPLRKYHKLRKTVLGLKEYHLYDGFTSLLEGDPRYGYDEVNELILESVKPLGEDYVNAMTEGLKNRWIDVYENEGKRSGAYSASVYGVHPYMLLNYQDTLNDVFTLAHELGHSMHSILSNESQPFVYSSYTIFVAEVASTLNEALLLDTMLKKSDDPLERAMLLQHAIDSISGTFYSQAMFADYELQAHKLVESGYPITSDTLSEVYHGILKDFYGDAVDHDDLYKITWARIPHFFNSPYYVYQYATCYASSATLIDPIRSGDKDALERYITLLKSGSCDHPMNLLKSAGADLAKRETVEAVVNQLDTLVDQLADELKKLGHDID